MKKSVLLICAALISGYATNSYAVDPIAWGPADSFEGCYSWACGRGGSAEWYLNNTGPNSRNCADYTAMCVYLSGRETAVASCQSCNPGYELVKSTDGITACSDTGDPKEDGGGVGSYYYTRCTKNCQASNCASTSWTALRTGYETRTYRSCSATGTSGTCNASTQYQCAAGYYAKSGSGSSLVCDPCPTWTGVYTTSSKTTLVRGTSNAGATAITGCYVKPGTYYDATGTFKTSGNCEYK